MFSNDALARVVILFSPGDILDGANAAIFEHVVVESPVAKVDLPGWVYVAAAVVGIVGTIGLTLRRYLRISA